MSRERERFEEVRKKIKRESDVAAFVAAGGRRLGGPPGVLNTVTPCAACKLLRRRCAQECPFSPYFSPHEPHKFASVHKVFGASNVSKLLMEVPENQRADTANSLVYEANVRLRDPVYGCMGAISALQQQLQLLQAELNNVRAEILKYKYREINVSNINITTNNSTSNNANNNINTSTSSTNNNNNNSSSNNNDNNDPATSHVTFFSNTGSLTLPTQAPPPPRPPPIPPAAHDPPKSSISSSVYSQQPSAGASSEYSTISNDNISYFG